MTGRSPLAALLMLSLLSSRLAGQEVERVLIELRLGRIATRTVEAFRSGDEVLLPLGTFFELAELRAVHRPDGTLEGLVQPGNVPLLVDPASRTLTLGKTRKQLARGDVYSNEQEIYLGSATLGRALSLEINLDWSELQVMVVDPGALPIGRRVRRESLLRSRLAGDAADRAPGLRLGLERPKLDGLVLDYALRTPTSGLEASSYSTTLGLDVLGGSLALGLQSQDGAGRAPRGDFSWSGIWRENRWLSQAQLGDGYATGPRPRSVRGFAISNSPYVRPATLGVVPFAGRLGDGWTVEAYRGGRMIGFDSVNALGQFSFDVPVQYGENPVDFVAYGPFGEVREFNQTYRVESDGLPAHRFEYGLSGGACRTDRCVASGNLDLRYGLSTRWTVRGGMDQFWRDSLGGLTHPYVGVTGNLLNAVMVEGDAVANAVVRGAIRVEPSVNLRVEAEANRFARGVADPILTPGGRLSQWTLTTFLRPASQLGSTYLEASLDRINTAAGGVTSGRLGSSFQLAEVRLIPAVRFQRQTGGLPGASQTFFSLNSFVLPHASLGRFLGSISARTTLEVERGVGMANAAMYLGFPLTRGLRSEAGLTWFRGMRGAGFSLLIAADLPGIRSYTTVSGGGGTQTMGSQYLSGSAIYDRPRGGVDFSGQSALQRGGVTGRVFLDSNGNGRRDPGEPLLPGVRVVVGQSFSVTDSSGGFRVWDLLPYEPTRVGLDSASLPSPLWVPAFAAVAVEPSPNRYRTLDIPVLPGGVIEGSVRRSRPADQGELGGGIVVVLRNRESGEQRALTTFSDGSFYAIGIRPGTWELAVDPDCLRVLHARAAPRTFTMAADPEGRTVSDLNLVLH
jgi:hypothetical protein